MTERGTEHERTRRRFLWGLGAGGSVALAGCANGAAPGGGDGIGDDSDDEADADDDTGSNDEGATDDGDTAVHQVGDALTGPAWDPEVRGGFCVLFRDAGDVQWLLRDADAGTRAFVEETDFDSSVLAYAESIGPTTCHNALSFADISVRDETLTADATVENTAAADEVCGEAITYSGAFLRVTADPLPEAIRLSITDGWGETVDITGDDPIRDPDRLDGFVRPDDDPETVPAALACGDESFERHPSVSEGAVSWGSGGGVGEEDGLELRVVDPTSGDDESRTARRFECGDALRIGLTNVSNRPIGVGNYGKYNLEAYTEAGWTEVRGGDDANRFGYTDELLYQPPGETTEWTFELTESGLIAGGPHEDALRVCPDLQSGRYRFVFWGADDLAVAFDYVDG